MCSRVCFAVLQLQMWRVRVSWGNVLGLWQHTRVLLVLERLSQECCGIAVGSPGSSRTWLCPTAPIRGLSCAPAPHWAPNLLCAALAEPRPDLLGLMAPRFISPFPETWKLLSPALWRLLHSASRGAATPPAPLSIPPGKQRPSASPALQTENHLKNLSGKGVLSWKLEKLVGSSHQIASTASEPTAPQEGAQVRDPSAHAALPGADIPMQRHRSIVK